MKQNKQVVVLGMGISGRAACRYLLNRGFPVLGIDKNQQLLNQHAEIQALCKEGLHIQGEDIPIPVQTIDFCVASPGVPPTNPIYQQLRKADIKIIGEVELACRDLAHPCLAITGSNGKTTTTLLVEHILNHQGVSAKAVGNVGVPVTEIINQETSKQTVLVLELSSWQLETLTSAPLDAGVILNITPNHLDRHASLEEYARTKIHMKNCLKPGKKLYVGAQCYRDFGEFFDGFDVSLFGYEKGCALYCDRNGVFVNENIEFILPPEYRGKVSHDVENMMAAYALCREAGISGSQFISAFRTFKKPPHRIEFVCSCKGVSYYNDSKGTNIDAVIKAVDSMPGDTILIAGGVHKGASYTPWIEAFRGKVKAVCAIGQAAEYIRQDLASMAPVEIFSTLEEAVQEASKKAKNGWNVLLSTGCSSFDMFRDYIHRGDEFKRIVKAFQEPKEN